jgi:TRAP-type transport system small permease protein
VLDRVLDRIEQWLLPLLALLLAVITAGVFVQVVLRYAFSTAFLWGEELSLFAFIWCVFLGAAIGVRRGIHLGFDFLGEMLTGRAAALQRVLVDLLILATAILLLVEGWTFAELSLKRLSPALGITLFIPTIVIPLSGALMLAFIAAALMRDLQALRAPRKP